MNLLNSATSLGAMTPRGIVARAMIVLLRWVEYLRLTPQ
jgi:hypothetical protein